MKKLIPHILLALFIFGCENSTGTDEDMYSVSDLEGTWMGDITIIGAPNSGTYQGDFSYDDQGNCIEFMGTNDVGGNLDVSKNGEITGIITSIYDTDYGEETNYIDVEESMFISKIHISLDATNCNWSNLNGNSGSYSVTGTMNKSN